MKTKPFNLQKALDGEPVVTVDGRKVIEIKLFNSNCSYPLCVLIEGSDCPTCYTLEGVWLIGEEFMGAFCDSRNNLLMLEKSYRTLRVYKYLERLISVIDIELDCKLILEQKIYEEET